MPRSLQYLVKKGPIDIAYYCLGVLPGETKQIEITYISYSLFGIVSLNQHFPLAHKNVNGFFHFSYFHFFLCY